MLIRGNADCNISGYIPEYTLHYTTAYSNGQWGISNTPPTNCVTFSLTKFRTDVLFIGLALFCYGKKKMDVAWKSKNEWKHHKTSPIQLSKYEDSFAKYGCVDCIWSPRILLLTCSLAVIIWSMSVLSMASSLGLWTSQASASASYWPVVWANTCLYTASEIWRRELWPCLSLSCVYTSYLQCTLR